MKVYIFLRKFKLEFGHYKMWSIGQYNRWYSIPTVTKYCFNILGSTIMFTCKGIY